MNSLAAERGPIGIWTAQFDYQPAVALRETAAELERLGFGVAWGDLTTICDRVRQHHLCRGNSRLHSSTATGPQALPISEWRELASALLPPK